MMTQRKSTAFATPQKRNELARKEPARNDLAKKGQGRKEVSKEIIAENDDQADLEAAEIPADEQNPQAAPRPAVKPTETPKTPEVAIPLNILVYLEKAHAIKKSAIESLDEKLAVAQVGLRSSTGDAKGEWTRTIKILEKTLSDVKKTDVTCFIPDSPTVGDIGAIRGIQIEAVLDDRSIILSYLRTESTILPSAAIVNEIDTKKMRAGQSAATTDLFIVVAVSSDAAPLSSDIRLKGLRYTPLISIKQFKKSDIDKYRDDFEEKKR